MPSEDTRASGSAGLFDGVTAQDHAVTATLATGRILLVPADPGNPPDCPLAWPLEESHAVGGKAGDRMTVTTRSAPDARLVVRDPALRAALAPVLRGSPGRTDEHRRAVRWAAGLGVAVLLLAATAGLASGYAARFLPAGWGGNLSDRMLQQLSAVHPPCSGREGVLALNRLAAGMADALHAPGPKVVTVRWDLVNAFALPGGRVVLTSGLIEHAGAPQAVAAVLAHEIGHVARRDPLARMLRENLVDVAMSAVFGVSFELGPTGAVAGMLLDNSYTRDQEAGADAAAVRILNALDIDPGPGARFFDRLAAEESGLGAVTWLRSHPLSAGRAEDLRRAGTGRGPGLSAGDWRAVQAICR